jgi:squalene cyclase
MRAFTGLAALLLLLPLAAARCEPTGDGGWRPSFQAPRPQTVSAPKPEELEAAIQRGVQFLLNTQNKDGSWGSARINRPGDIFAPVPGAHQAFRAAVTSLCVSALIEIRSSDEEVNRAIDRGEAWLLTHLPKVRRANGDAIYNVWAHAYAIQALVRMYERRPGDPQRSAEIKRQIGQQIDLLRRYEHVDGGWGYYDFDLPATQKPSGITNSFVTATVLWAFHEAKRIGVEPPPRLVQRGMASLRRQRKPDFSYDYDEDFKYRPMALINRPGGSLGRSQACNLAMRAWGDTAVTDEVLRTWLDRLFARNLWLDLGRKRPIPHESWFQVAGYFFYYGHYYAALCIEQVQPEERPFYQAHLARLLIRLQEKDGSWWDFPMFDYHRQYGTAFAIMSLLRARG